MARINLESEMARKRSLKSYDFFQASREKQRKLAAEKKAAEASARTLAPERVPIPEDEEFDPEKHDFHQALPASRTRALSLDQADPASAEASEREAKRLRRDDDDDDSLWTSGDLSFACMATEVPQSLKQQATARYFKEEVYYMHYGISLGQFLFGVKRNTFEDKYFALAANDTGGQKKKGRKEIKLSELSSEQQLLFTGDGGADDREWKA